MSADEPDATPITRQHITDFLKWYQQQVQARGPARDVAFAGEWWFNAMHTLTLGQLREGIRSYMRFESKLVLSPVEFWGLCTGTKDERAIAEFRQMRDTVRNAPPIPKPTKETRNDGRQGKGTRKTPARNR